MLRITDYEIVDHGPEHEQYFQGSGVAFTRYSDHVLGAGDSPHDAADEALEALAQCGLLDDENPVVCRLLMECSALPKESEIPLVEGDEPGEVDVPHPDWRHYVSIRYNVEKGE